MSISSRLCPDITGCNSVDQEDVGSCDIAVIKRKRDSILLSRAVVCAHLQKGEHFWKGVSHAFMTLLVGFLTVVSSAVLH